MHHGIGKCNPPADGLFHKDAEDAQEVSSSATDGMDADGPEVSLGVIRHAAVEVSQPYCLLCEA